MREIKRILIVEDLDDTCEMLENIFSVKCPDMLVSIVKTLDAAYEAVSSKSFDLIFLDGTLTQSAPGTEPETIGFFNEIKWRYLGRIFSTTDTPAHMKIMNSYGVPHVKKDKIPEVANDYFVPRRVFFERKPSKDAYNLTVGSLLVVNVLGETRSSCLSPFIVEIVQTKGGLTLKLGDEFPLLKHGDFYILDTESCMIQGTEEDQDYLIRIFDKNVKGPIRTALRSFGGAMRFVEQMPKQKVA